MDDTGLLILAAFSALFTAVVVGVYRLTMRLRRVAETDRLVQAAGGTNPRRARRLLVATTLVVAVLALWVGGTFDRLLAPVHLNFNDCARNAYGATFCGDERFDTAP